MSAVGRYRMHTESVYIPHVLQNHFYNYSSVHALCTCKGGAHGVLGEQEGVLDDPDVTGDEGKLPGSVCLRRYRRELSDGCACNTQLALAGDPQNLIQEAVIRAVDHAAVNLAGVDVAGGVALLAELEELTLGVEGPAFGADGEAAAVCDVLNPECDIMICTALVLVGCCSLQ